MSVIISYFISLFLLLGIFFAISLTFLRTELV